ncbi:MAG: NADAR family protein [Ruthenibacterium sp.]
MNPITEFRGSFFFLSNFYHAPLEYGGLTYQNSEAAFQATKYFGDGSFEDTIEVRKRFCNLSPSDAKKLGRKMRLRDDWEDIKDLAMHEICVHKFTQNPELGQKLLDTGDAELVEGNEWGDQVWGVCDGVGENRLGKILMRVRAELKESPHLNWRCLGAEEDR